MDLERLVTLRFLTTPCSRRSALIGVASLLRAIEGPRFL
jgi:hypothetical protein